MKSKENYIKAKQRLNERNKKEVDDKKNNELNVFTSLFEKDIKKL